MKIERLVFGDRGRKVVDKVIGLCLLFVVCICVCICLEIVWCVRVLIWIGREFYDDYDRKVFYGD